MAGAAALTGRSNSISVQSTLNAAAAFGDDIADDSYSVSELSHYDEDKRSRRHNKVKSQGQTFLKAKLSQLERQESVPPDQSSAPAAIGLDEGNGTAPHHGRKGSSSSTGHSDDGASVNQDSEDSDFTVTTFASFAQTRFQIRIPYTYSCSALPQPLLPKPDRVDYLAALASWLTLLRIMGDMPDVDTGDSLIVTGASTPTITRVKTGFKGKFTKRDVDDIHTKISELFKYPISADTHNIPFLPSVADTMLDKVQLVCSMGIYRPCLRDELYSQLCKQLTNNPSQNSMVRGWVLFLLFAGSFAPSERLAPSLAHFVSEGPVEFAEKVDRQFRRTCTAGTRSYPPSWLEFQAAKNGKPLLVPVTFMNGFRILCDVDSATTIQELIFMICERLGVQDSTGYAIYVSVHTKISCLGNSHHRILDAISECEQHSKQMGLRQNNATWRLFFRREMFTPWYQAGLDPVCTDLTYQQLKRGVTLGEYMMETEAILLDNVAKCFYVEHKEDVNLKELPAFIKSFVPSNILERKTEGYYLERVTLRYADLKLDTAKLSEDNMKAEVVRFAMNHFHILFCRYYDAQRVLGPGINLVDMVLGLNAKGIYFVDNNDALKTQIHFSEIVELVKAKHQLTIRVSSMEEYVVISPHADDLLIQLNTFLDQLKRWSTLAIALQDITQLDGPSDKVIIKGDILELSQPLNDLGRSDTVAAMCRRTRKSCDVPKSVLYVVASMEEPKPHTLDTLSSQVRKGAHCLMMDGKKDQHTLQQFAKIYFRSPTESTMTKFLSKASFKRDKLDPLWSFTKDSLKKPLLRRTCIKDDICKLACHTFTSIQTYMTNLVINNDTTNYKLCKDWILDPARRNKYMREEIFCQVMKQITNNPDRSSEERGWVLLTLLTSLMRPTTELSNHLLNIVQRSDHPLKTRCELHLKTNRSIGACRLYSSHQLEHDMVMRQQPNVRVKVFLPNQVSQIIDVISSTKIYDMKKEIASRLKLKTFAEHSLFLSAKYKVYCLPDKAYYFDCLSHSEIYWIHVRKRNSSSPPATPFLVMLKKIWVNGQPGIDHVADMTFHYPQESPNYQLGYHLLPDALVHRLAALSYHASFHDAGHRMDTFRDVAPLILPQGFLEGKNIDQVKALVQQEYQTHKNLTTDQAKTAFLQDISKLNTYGSVFFEVKQRNTDHLPKSCLLAINYTGVHIIHGTTKEVIRSYDYQSVPNWAFDGNSFTLIVNTGSGSTSKLLFETKVGHNMDDLVMSYVAWIMNFQMRKKHGYLGEAAGESIC